MVVIKNLVMTCSACPSQWEGTTQDGDHVYIRYRWGGLRVEINHQTVLMEDIGDSLDGVMSTEELAGHLADRFIIEGVTPPSPGGC